MSDTIQYDYKTIEDPDKMAALADEGWQMAQNQPFAGKVIMQRAKEAVEPETSGMSDLTSLLDEREAEAGGELPDVEALWDTPPPVPGVAPPAPRAYTGPGVLPTGVNPHYVVGKSTGVRRMAPAVSEKVVLGRGHREQQTATVVAKMSDMRYAGKKGYASSGRMGSDFSQVPGGLPGERAPERGRRLLRRLSNTDVTLALEVFDQAVVEIQQEFHDRSQQALEAIADPAMRARATIVTVILRNLAPQAKFINWSESRLSRSRETHSEDHLGFNVLCEYHQVIRFEPVSVSGFEVFSNTGEIPVQSPTDRDLEMLFEMAVDTGREGGIQAPTDEDQEVYDEAGTPTEYQGEDDDGNYPKLFGKRG